MTHEEIIAMAHEVGLLPDNSHPTPETRAMRKRCEVVKHFAALVAEKAAAKEREACQKIADDCADADMHASMAANAIRARG